MDNQPEKELIQQQAEEMKALLEATKQDIADLRNSTISAKQIIVSIESYGKRFGEIQALLDNPENGIIASHTTSKLQKESIDAIKLSSDEQLLQIKNALATVQANIQQMNDAYQEFLEVKTKLNDPEIGLEKVYENSEAARQEIVALKKQSEIVSQEIKKFRDGAQAYAKEIEVLKQTSEENKNVIQGYEEESKDFKGKIEKIYKIATDAALANSFDERKQGLKKLQTDGFGLSLYRQLLYR